MDRNTGIKVYLVAVVCAVTTGFSFLAAKKALVWGNPLESLFFRFAVGFLFAAVLVGLKVVRTDLRKKKMGPLLIPALLYSAGFFGFQFFGLLYASSVEAGIIMAAQPAITMILAELAIKEKPTKAQRACVLAAILAAAFISAYGSGGVDTVDIRGIILILMSTISLSANIVYIRWIRDDYTPAEISFVSCAIGFVIYSVAAVIYGASNSGLGNIFANLSEPGFVISILYLGIACTMLTTLMNSYVMRYLEAVKASVLGCIGTVITLLAGFFILGEELGAMQILCSAVILLAVVGTNYFGAKKNG